MPKRLKARSKRKVADDPQEDRILTLEKLEISKRLGTLELHLTECMGKIEAHMQNEEIYRDAAEARDTLHREQIMKILTTHDKILIGNNGSPGMVKQVDRLVQTDKSRTWSVRALWIGFISLVVKVVADVMGQHGG